MVINSQRKKLRDLLSTFNINEKIIRTCLNRQVPFNNAYWTGSDTYIIFSVRFLSIPFWLEICIRLNLINEEKLLSDSYLSIMEQILHFSEEEELGLITHQQCILKCRSIKEIKAKLDIDKKLADRLSSLVDNYPKYKALRRGNFLAYFTVLLSDDSETIINTSKRLIDLIICGCVIDDLQDVREDLLNNEDNIILELGNNLNSLNTAKELFNDSKNKLLEVFPELDLYFNKVLMQSVLIYITSANEK